MIKWIKKGKVYSPKTELWWNKSHAMIPTPEKLEEGLVKIYFSGRDKNNVSHIGFFLINLLSLPSHRC